MATSTVALNKNILLDAQVFNYNGLVTLKDLPSSIDKLKIYNARGQLVFQKDCLKVMKKWMYLNLIKASISYSLAIKRGLESKKLIF